jgi:hypothetical protein
MRRSSWLFLALAGLGLGAASSARALDLGASPGKIVSFPDDGRELDDHPPSLAITAGGVLFSLVNAELTTDTSEIVVWRSADSGVTWDIFDIIDAPGTRYQDAQLGISAGGGLEYLVVAYYADAGAGSVTVLVVPSFLTVPAWATIVVENFPDVPGSLPNVEGLTLATTAAGTAPVPQVAVAYAVETAAEDWELHYAFSPNGGLGFLAGLTVYDFPPLAAGTTRTIDLALGFSGGNHVNLAGLRAIAETGNDRMELSFARATNNGMALANWPVPATLIASDTSAGYSELTMASQPGGDNVVVGYQKTNSPAPGAKILASLDGGVSWSPATIDGPAIRNHLNLYWTAEGVRGTLADASSYYLVQPDGGPLGPYTTESFLIAGHLLVQPAALALDPTRGNQAAIAAVMHLDAQDDPELVFNAEWRDGAGFADLKSGGLFITGGVTAHFVTAPGVADLDDDGVKDIVAVDDLGFVRRYGILAGQVATYEVGATGACSLPVLFDLDSDDAREVVVGSTNGRVHALDADLVSLPAFPINLGGGFDVYVSAAPITGYYSGEIVAASGNQVHVLGSDGQERPGWPVTFPGANAAGRAAIGDVNGDGTPEIVAALSTGVAILEADGTVRDFLLGAAVAPASGVTLSDLDDDGDLEIAVPLINGRVALLNRDGSTVNGAWPFNTFTGSPIVGVTVADVENAGDPVLCFSTDSGSVFAVNVDGSLLAGYPVQVAVGDNASTEPILGRVARPNTARPQLLVGTRTGWLHEWTSQAETPADWPNWYDNEPAQSVVVTDIEDDGLADLVVTVGRFILVCDTGTDELANPAQRWVMSGHDLARTGCTDGVPAQPTAVGDPEPQPGATRVAFAGAFPNPAPGRTTFSFSLSAAASVELAVFDVRGRRVRDFGRQDLAAGTHGLAWDGRDGGGRTVASGVYVARLVVGGGADPQVVTRQLVLRN